MCTTTEEKLLGETTEKRSYSASQNFDTYMDSVSEAIQRAYIQNRVLGQIDWYDKKAIHNQKRFKKWMIGSILLSACIPALTMFSDHIIIKLIIIILSSAVTVISSILSLYHFQDLWIHYRSQCEILQSTLHCYFTKSGQFTNCPDEKAFQYLVTTCEESMTKEFQTWDTYFSPEQKG